MLTAWPRSLAARIGGECSLKQKKKNYQVKIKVFKIFLGQF